MLNRRYALLGWAVWKAGKFAARRRVRSMMPARVADEGPPAAVALVPVLVLAGAAAAWFLFFRKGGSRDEAEATLEPVG